MQNLFFVDLDDTLFQTLRKCQKVVDSLEELSPRAFLKNGEVISYSTPKQNHLWEALSQSGWVIPVTARNFDAFTRVDLVFNQSAILNHGAVVIDEHRNIDPEWQQHMANVLPPYQTLLYEVWEQIEELAKDIPALRPRLIEDFGICWYGVIKHADADETVLNQIIPSLQALPAFIKGDLYYHINSNNLAIIPKVVAKANAVKFLMAKYKNKFDNLLTVGIGDSKTDMPFMSLCDYAVIPGNTQLGAILRGL